MNKDLKQINNSKRKSGFTLAEVFSVHPKDGRKQAFTLAEVFSVHPKGGRKQAFTLAEVLITLGIIGVVAAMTLPTLITKYQKEVVRNQFKKSFATIQNAINQVQNDEGRLIECHYGGPVTSAATGECTFLFREIQKKLNVVRSCNGNALRDGCVKEMPQFAVFTGGGCGGFSQEVIENISKVYMLSDGSSIITYRTGHMPLFMLDVNGIKGPNESGKDIYSLLICEKSGSLSIDCRHLYGNNNPKVYINACIANDPNDKVYFRTLDEIFK